MNTTIHKIRVENEMFGTILDESFVDSIQFKLFLKMIHGCLELKENLTFFNGTDFLINVPYKYLSESVIVTTTEEYGLTERVKSKIEALVTN
jgi:hypothetical protein